ncbi:MAG: rhodanese-like domain-containing protein [Nitrosopumilus sp.]|nr:rhodanese-like domain-containing protein [Nitrosopumilus sp.]
MKILGVIDIGQMKNKFMPKNFEVTAEELQELLRKNDPLLIFDLRLQDVYKNGHIKGAVHAVCDAKAKETIMPKIPKDVRIVLVDEDGLMASKTAKIMQSFGLDSYYLKGGMNGWNKGIVKGNPPSSIESDSLWKKMQDSKDDIFLLDVRDTNEFSDFKIAGSVNIPLQDIFKEEHFSKIPKDKEIVTLCPHGNRAMVATFALAKNGIESRTLAGGLAGWSQVLNPVKAIEANPMIIQIEKIGKGCLSYMLISAGQVIVIDPLFPAEKYQNIAIQNNATIVKVIDTHQHADHLSSAWHLAETSNSTCYESELEQWDRTAQQLLKDGESIEFGQSKLRVISTPGHTPGSLSYVVDENYVFTGDILFIESIGRPDLRDKAEEFAGELYDSLHNKLLKLPSDTIVFPAHHGQTVRSKNGVFSTTIEGASKHEILQLSKEEFVKKVVGMTPPRPMNYQKIIQINRGSLSFTVNEIPDLEIGPNRCSIAGT